MTNSAIIDFLFGVVEERLEEKLERIIGVGPLPNREALETGAKKSYVAEIRLLNKLGEYLTGEGLNLDPIDPEEAYHKAYERVALKNEPE